MSAKVEPAIHDVLKTVQASIAELRTEMRAGFDEIRTQNSKERRNSTGRMRPTGGDRDLRAELIERRAAALEVHA